MTTNKDGTGHAQRIVVQCSCGNRVLALQQHTGKRLKCPACGHAVVVAPQDDDQPQVEDQSEGMSRAAIIAVWSFVGVFAFGSVLFLVSYSRSLDQAAIAAANEAESVERARLQRTRDDAILKQQRTRDDANSKVSVLIDEARFSLEAGDIATSQQKIEQALAVPHADAVAHATKLSEQIQNATDPTRIHDLLMGLSDETFQQLQKSGTMPAQMNADYDVLNRRAEALVAAQVERVAKARDAPRLAKLEKERAALEKLRELVREEAPPVNLIQKKVAQKGGTWEAFNKECGQTAYSSNQVRADALFTQNWQGKKVDWKGTVVAVRQVFGSYIITCKMPGSNSLVSDLSYKLPGTLRDSVLKLSKGDIVRIQGTIVSQGGVVLDHVVEYDE